MRSAVDDRLFGGRLPLPLSALRLPALRLRLAAAPVRQPGEAAGAGGEQQERQQRNAGQQRQQKQQAGGHAERLRVAAELAEQRLVGRAGDAGLGDDDAGGGRDDQRRDLRDQAVADGQQGVGVGGVAEAHAVLADADDDAADDVDEGDDQAGDGVAAHELGGAVHRAEEAAFLLQLLAARRAPRPRRSGRPRGRRRSPSACRAWRPG